jgi:hypothetical protein
VALSRRAAQVLKWWSFSDAFRYEMIFPLVALFFGTGNQVRDGVKLSQVVSVHSRPPIAHCP